MLKRRATVCDQHPTLSKAVKILTNLAEHKVLREVQYGQVELNDCLVYVGDTAISCSMSVLLTYSEFFQAWYMFRKQQSIQLSEKLSRFEVHLPQELDADAVIFLFKAFHIHEALPIGASDVAFANILIAFDLLQVTNQHLKHQLQTFPDSQPDPTLYYRLPVVLAAAKHNFPQLLASACAVRCMYNHYDSDEMEDIRVAEAYLNSQFDLLPNVDHMGLYDIISKYHCHNEHSRKVAEKIAREIIHEPRFHTIEIFDMADIVPPIFDALMNLQAPYYLRAGKKKPLDRYAFSADVTKKLMCMYSNALTCLQ